MHVSDYGYAAAPSAWTTTLGSFNNSSITNVNWMYMGLLEWPMTIQSDNSNNAFFLSSSGEVSLMKLANDPSYAIRPSFYLNSNVTFVSGSGTKVSPFIIN